MSQYNRPSEEIRDKRLPMAVVADVTLSMLFDSREHNRLKVMNSILEMILEECIQDPIIRSVMEVSFILFADDIVLETPFRNVSQLGPEMIEYAEYIKTECVLDSTVTWKKGKKTGCLIPVFDVSWPQDGTNIGKAVSYSVDLLLKRIKKIEYLSSSYPGYLMLISDGHPLDPDNSGYRDDLAAQEEAIGKLRSHTKATRDKNDMIVPFIIGVGNEAEVNNARLKLYTEHWKAGHYHFTTENDEVNWKFILERLKKSIRASVQLKGFEHIPDSNE